VTITEPFRYKHLYRFFCRWTWTCKQAHLPVMGAGPQVCQRRAASYNSTLAATMAGTWTMFLLFVIQAKGNSSVWQVQRVQKDWKES
jgi:hypothetical protein